MQVTVPTWRRDVEGAADLVEEVARIVGYDQVPSTPLERAPGVARPTATRSQLVERRVRRTAAARGLDEAVTWSFISDAEAEAFGGGDWKLANPISEDMKVMRPSLLPGLIAAARRNLDRGASSRAAVRDRPPLSRRRRAPDRWVAAGRRTHGRAAGKRARRRRFDAFDAKAEVLALLDAAGAPVANLQVLPDAGPTWHPGRSAKLGLGPRPSSPRSASCTRIWSKTLDAPAAAVAAEIYLDAIPAPRVSGHARAAYRAARAAAGHPRFRLHRSGRVCPRRTCSARSAAPTRRRLPRCACSTASSPPDGLSLAFEVTLQPVEKSFTDEQIGEVSKRIIAAAEKSGARLRG